MEQMEPKLSEVARSDRAERRAYLAEMLSAVLLGLATVGAAYGAYQASLYDGKSLDSYSEALAKVSDASAKKLEALQGYTFDMITWMEWQSRIISASKEAGTQSLVDEEIANSIATDFMEERLKQALIWADEESTKQNKKVHPSESEVYGLTLFQEAFDAEEQSQVALDGARKANDLGDAFTLTTVLFTIAMFFAGIALVFKKDRMKFAMIGIAALLLVFTAIRFFSLPMAG